jgi:hypothetical protein
MGHAYRDITDTIDIIKKRKRKALKYIREYHIHNIRKKLHVNDTYINIYIYIYNIILETLYELKTR